MIFLPNLYFSNIKYGGKREKGQIWINEEVEKLHLTKVGQKRMAYCVQDQKGIARFQSKFVGFD